jgi:hypothetical protein
MLKNYQLTKALKQEIAGVVRDHAHNFSSAMCLYTHIQYNYFSFGEIAYQLTPGGFGYFENKNELKDVPLPVSQLLTIVSNTKEFDYIKEHINLYNSCLVNHFPSCQLIPNSVVKDGLDDLPIIMLSLGCTSTFGWRKWPLDPNFNSLTLKSGDLLVYADDHRKIVQGVPFVFNDSDPDLTLKQGHRITLTFRASGYSLT